MSSLFHPVSALLEKIHSSDDVDVRYMCLRDLAAELSEQQQSQATGANPSSTAAAAAAASRPPLDATAQTRLCTVLRAQMMSTQGDIHEVACRCIPGLLHSVGTVALLPLLDSLLLHAFDPKSALPPVHLDSEEMADEREREARLESLRMKAFTAIRLIWTDLSQAEVREQVAKKILPHVVAVVRRSTDKDYSTTEQPSQLFSLPSPHLTNAQLGDFVSFLHAVLAAHPESIVPFHTSLLDLFHALLLFPSSGLLKLSLDCISAVSSHLAPSLQQAFTSGLLDRWPEFQRSRRESAFFHAHALLIASMGNSLRSVCLTRLVETMRVLLISDQTGRYDECADEREAALLCLDTLLRHAAAASLDHLPSLLPLMQAAAQYDPNFVGDTADQTNETSKRADDGDEEEMQVDDDGEEEDYGLGGDDDDDDENDADAFANEFVDDGGEEDVDGDDDDASWKVRRAAARCVQSALGVVMVASGSATEQQQQAYEASLPRRFVQTLASTPERRQLFRTSTNDLARLLLTRLTERTDYIQVEWCRHYQELLTWSTQHQAADSSSFLTSGSVTLLAQLRRLFSSGVKSKSSASDLRRIEHAAALLVTVLRSVSTQAWDTQAAASSSSSFFTTHIAPRLRECTAIDTTAVPAMVPVLIRLLGVVEASWGRLVDDGWRQAAAQWLQARLDSSPLDNINPTISAALLRASHALITAITETRGATLVERCLEARHRLTPPRRTEATNDNANASANASAPGTTWQFSRSDTAAFFAVSRSRAAGLLASSAADRDLLVLATSLIARTTHHAPPPAFNTLEEAQSTLTDSCKMANSAIAVATKLMEHASTRIAACECVTDLVSPATLAPEPLATLALFLKQRDRLLLRSSLACVRAYVDALGRQRYETVSGPADPVEAALQKHILPALLTLVTDGGESWFVEQTCSVVILANLLRHLQGSEAAVQPSSPVHAALLAYLRQHARGGAIDRVLFDAAIDAVHAVLASCVNEAQRTQWVADRRRLIEESKEEETRSSLVRSLSAFSFGSLVDQRKCGDADLGRGVAQFEDRAGVDEACLEQTRQQAEAIAQDGQTSSRLSSIALLGSVLSASPRLELDLLRSSLSHAIDASLPPSVQHAYGELLARVIIDGSSKNCGDYLGAVLDWFNEAPPNENKLVTLHQCLLPLSFRLAHISSPASSSSTSDGIVALLDARFPSLLASVFALLPSVTEGTSSRLVDVLLDLTRLRPSSVLARVQDEFNSQATQDESTPQRPRALVQLLQRWIEDQQESITRWQLESTTSSAAAILSSTFVASLQCWAHPDLDALLACAALATTWCTTAHAMGAKPHLRDIFARVQLLLVKQSRYVSSRRYGPSSRLVDTSVPLRCRLWELIGTMAQTARAADVATATIPAANDGHSLSGLRSGLLAALLAGVVDDASEVLLVVHSLVPQLVQVVAPSIDEWRLLVTALTRTITAPTPPDAVREEMLAHADMQRSAVRAAEACDDVIRQAGQWVDEAARPPLDEMRHDLQTTVQHFRQAETAEAQR